MGDVVGVQTQAKARSRGHVGNGGKAVLMQVPKGEAVMLRQTGKQ